MYSCSSAAEGNYTLTWRWKLAVSVPRQSLRVVPPESFSTLLKRQRQLDHLTQKQLANRFGVKQQTIAAWEQGNRPDSSHFAELARYLSMVEKDLVALIDSQPKLPIHLAKLGANAKESAYLIMQQLASSFMESDRKGTLTPEVAEAYSKFADYFRSAE